MRRIMNISAALLISCVCQARVITVDDDGVADFATIQAAIDDANDGDVISVADGTYLGLGNRGIRFFGKAVMVRSTNGLERCIIDCEGQDRGFYFQDGEGSDSIVEGFTIRKGKGSLFGGGMWCRSSSPMIRDCVIENCTAPNGGGIACSEQASPEIRDCRLVFNSGVGGGIYSLNSTPVIVDCLISENVSPLDCDPLEGICLANQGGGIASDVSRPMILGCVISKNEATAEGGGVYCYSRGKAEYNPVLKGCLIWGNKAGSWGESGAGGGLYRCQGEIVNCTIYANSAEHGGDGLHDCGNKVTNCIMWGNGDDLYLTYATYSCIEDNDVGVGNIHVDPCFVDPNKGDFHLKSQAGRWDPNEVRWVRDDVTSPCIDAGDPMSPIGLEPFPNGGRINMGAYGGTAEASKSWFGKPVCETIIAGDINGDCVVDFKDFGLLALHWLSEANHQ